jgi:hypothetical protein
MSPSSKGVQLIRALGRGAWGVLFFCDVQTRKTDEGKTMTVRDLRAGLANMAANSEVQVVLLKHDGTCEVFALEEILSNDGYAPLEIYEAEPVREEHPEG